MMTKKDFKKFANAIAEQFPNNDFASDLSCNELILRIAPILKDNNPRFDEKRFREWIRRVRAGESTKGLR